MAFGLILDSGENLVNDEKNNAQGYGENRQYLDHEVGTLHTI
jgi:hypothetical protein